MLLTKRGYLKPVNIALSSLGVINGVALTAVAVHDASAQRTCMRELETVASTDNLTGADGFGFTVNFGVAEVSVPDEPADTVLQRADAALYDAKRGGRNTVVHYRDGLALLTPTTALG